MARAGIPKIDIRFDVDANGLLTATALDLATNKRTKLRCDGLVLSESDLNAHHTLVQDWIRCRKTA